jgi:hypothetical protein
MKTKHIFQVIVEQDETGGTVGDAKRDHIADSRSRSPGG